MNTDKPVAISAATPADIPRLVALLGLLFTQEADFASNPDRQRDGLTQVIEDSRIDIVFVARDALGEAIGMVSLLFTVSTVTGGKAAWLEDMIVAPPARQCGIGSQLLRHAIQWGRENGITRLTLLTDADNTGAFRFYTRYGFAPSPMTVLRLSLTNDD